ncbi:tail fiber protein [Massilia terrae]|uniref:Tail fiber protein n=1 Tax=Massilia terrae TaxID=1811224 RepID=A0ABT2D4H7_9BURK|nr:tail fiber protein [Massilia terrae]MCS0661154.1 tail fiber protein [Massilia terrae]
MDAFLGEIRMFCGTYAPADWAFCEGQLLPISANTALFSLLGVQYGGNGTTNFALPDLRGKVPVNQGAGPGLSLRTVGETGGAPSVTLTEKQMPAHNHLAQGISKTGTTKSPSNAVWSQFASEARPPVPVKLFAPNGDVQMAPTALAPSGGNQPHNNMQPYLGVNFIICMRGIFPPRD